MALAGWLKRKPVTLSRASGAVTNYQMKLKVGESAGSGANDVLATGCKTDFSDLRFTTAADGLLDYYIEDVTGVTPNQVATIWIEFDSIGTGATSFYMYYGNAGAAAVSNGANTFIKFDDFERGVNADPIGGNWTIRGGNCDISTTRSCGGTRSGKLVAQNPQSFCTLPVTASADIAIQVRAYKPDLSSVDFTHGDAGSYVYLKWESDGHLWHYNGSVWVDDGVCSEDAWHLFELYGFDYTANQFSLALDGTEIVAAGAQRPTAGYNGVLAIEERTNTVGLDDWFDNVIVRNWRATGPAWGAWGGEENLSAGSAIPVMLSQYRRRAA